MREEKTQMIEDIGELLDNAEYVYFVKYKGLDVGEFSDFRGELSKNDSACHVLKNRLIKRALERRGDVSVDALSLTGDTAMITGTGDPGVVAKVIADFAKRNEAVAPKSGLIDGEPVGESDVRAIASLPPRDVLLSQVVGLIQAPARDLVGVLNAKLTSLLNVLNAYKNKLQESE